MHQSTGRQLAEGERQAQHKEKHPAGRASYGHWGASLKTTIRTLALDQEQAAVVLTALNDAATLRREAIGNCPECRSAGERLCTDHEGSWEAAEAYDDLRWQLDSFRRESEADQETGMVTDDAPPGPLQTEEPDVPADHTSGNGQRAAALESGQIGRHSEPGRGECLPPAVPDPGRGIPPEVYNVIADYAPNANRSGHGRDGEPYTATEEHVALAEWLGGSRAGPGAAEDQITGRNEASDHRNEADDYESDREAGE